MTIKRHAGVGVPQRNAGAACLLALGVAGGAGEIGDSDGEIGPLAGEIGDLRLERGDASGAGSEGGREGVVDGRAVGGFHLGDSLIALERVHLRRQQ
jgi:hypothetical protein